MVWNRRLRRAGRAVIDTYGKKFQSARIELSPAYFEVYPEDLAGILVHEAVHVGLAIQGRPFGHGPEFKRACEAAGGLLHSRWMPGRVFRYQCPICRTTLERRRRVSDSRWCAECVGAAEAAEYGLALEAVPAAELDAHVRDLAQKIAANSAGSIAAYKDLYAKADNSGLNDGLSYEETTNYDIEDVGSRLSTFLSRL